MKHAEYSGAKVTFSLPFWVMEDRFSRPPRLGEYTDGNVIEDALFDIDGIVQVCLNHQVWCEAELSCAPAELPGQIELTNAHINKVLSTFARRRTK